MQLCFWTWAAILSSCACECVYICLYVHLILSAPGLKQLLYAGLQMHIDFKTYRRSFPQCSRRNWRFYWSRHQCSQLLLATAYQDSNCPKKNDHIWVSQFSKIKDVVCFQTQFKVCWCCETVPVVDIKLSVKSWLKVCHLAIIQHTEIKEINEKSLNNWVCKTKTEIVCVCVCVCCYPQYVSLQL